MAARTIEKPKPRLKNLDELFNLSETTSDQEIFTQQSNQSEFMPVGNTSELLTVLTIPFDLMDNFKDHPFSLYDGERKSDMIESIKTNGILQPLILRPKDDGRFEILSGHNRKNCAIEAGCESGPVIIKEGLSEVEALMYVIETNLIQRSFSDMSHSEKAAVLAVQYSKLFSQGKRNDIIEELEMLENPNDNAENPSSPLLGARSRSDQKIGQSYNLSKNTVARYLRIDKLTPELKKRLDADEISLYPAVTLSFLKPDEQDIVNNCLKMNDFKVDMKKAEILRGFSNKGKLSDENVYLILNGELGQPPKKKRAQTVKVRNVVYERYFPHNSNKEVEQIVEKALDVYFSLQRKKHERESDPDSQIPYMEDDESDQDDEINMQ